MPGPCVQRNIVKSQPELWSELSDVTSLARHLGAFGEITITRLEPETAVAWEGDRARGTVTLERSGWGTTVTVTAEAVEGDAVPEAMADVTGNGLQPAPEPVCGPTPPRLRWWWRLFRRPLEPEAVARQQAEPEPAPEPVTVPELGPEDESTIRAMLDHLAAAHHRPFSRG